MNPSTLLPIIGLSLGSLIACTKAPRAAAPAGVPTDSNIVFGNVGNAALLMDVYRPRQANGLGIIFISGSGWGGASGYSHGYDDIPLKDDARGTEGYVPNAIQGLTDAGFTVFSINHRFAPESRFPGPFYDAQRAVRFIRAHAATYGIDPKRLGAIGHSSGGHLAALLGVTDTTIDNPNSLPYQRGSSHVQAVVTLAAPFVVTGLNTRRPVMVKMIANLLDSLPKPLPDGSYPMTPHVADASPLMRATGAAAPMLIYQAEDDSVVLKASAVEMAARLSAVGVPNKLVMQPTGNHAPRYDITEIAEWFRRYLR